MSGTNKTVYVNNTFTSQEAVDAVLGAGVATFGVNAFADINEAEGAAEGVAEKMVIAAGTVAEYTKDQYYFLNTDPNNGGKNNAFDNVVDGTYDIQADGKLRAYQILLNNADTVVSKTGKLYAFGEQFKVMGGTLTVNGTRAKGAADPEKSDIIASGSVGNGAYAADAVQIEASYLTINQGADVAFKDTLVFVKNGAFNIDNATVDFANTYVHAGHYTIGGNTAADRPFTVNFSNGAEVTLSDGAKMVYDDINTMNIVVDGTSTFNIEDSTLVTGTLTNNGTTTVSGESTLNIGTGTGKINLNGTILSGSDLGGMGIDVVANDSIFQTNAEKAVKTGNLSVNYDTTTATEDATLTINGGGTLNAGTVYLGWSDKNSEIIFSGANTVANIGSVYAFYNSTFTIEDGAKVNAGASAFYGDINVDNATLEIWGDGIGLTDRYSSYANSQGVELSLTNDAVVSATSIVIGDWYYNRGTGAAAWAGGGTVSVNDSTLNLSGLYLRDYAEDVANAVVNLEDGATLTINNSIHPWGKGKLYLGANNELNMDASSFAAIQSLEGAGTITIDATDFAGVKKVIDVDSSADFTGTIDVIGNDKVNVIYGEDGDIILSTAATDVLYVNSSYSGEFGADLGDGKYFGVNAFDTFDAAADAAAAEETIIKVSGDASGKAVFANGKKYTISGTADIAWKDGWFMIGRGVDDAVATEVTFKDAVIGTPEEYDWTVSTGFNVAQDEGEGSGKANGTLNIENSKILTAYMANRNVVNVKGNGLEDGEYGYNGEANLTVLNGFYVSRDNGDTLNAEMNLTNGAYVKVEWENGMGIGYDDGRGVLNITDSKFEASGDQVATNPGELTVHANGAINVTDGVLIVDNTLTNNGTFTVAGESTLNIGTVTGKAIYTEDGAVIKDSTIGGATVFANGDLTFKGANTIGVLNPGWYNNKITIGAGDSLKATGSRSSLGYGNTIDVDGEIADAKAVTDKTQLTKSLELVGGWSITGAADGTLDVDNAYVSFGSTTSKDKVADGNFVLDFNNSIVDFTNDFQTAASTVDGLAPEFQLNVKGSVVSVGTRFAFSHENSTAVVDNSTVTIAQQFKNAGEFTLQNGSEMTVGSNADGPSYEKTGNFGTLNVASGSTFDMSEAANASYPLYNAGTINVADATFTAGSVSNNGTVNVTGESTLKIDNLTGNGIILDDATLSADSNIGGSTATKVYGTSVIKGTVGTVHANWTGVKENGFYIGYTTDKVALTLDGATTGNVYVGSDTEGYGAELTVSGGSTVGGIYCRVYGSANITGSDNVISYINAKGTVTVEDAEKTKIVAMVAEGGTVNIIDSDIDIAIGSSNNIQLDEGTTMEISGSTVDIQQLSIDATSALKLTKTTFTVTGVYGSDLITNNGSITIDGFSTLTADSITFGENATITIDGTNFAGGVKKIIDLNGTESLEGKVTLVNGDGLTAIYGEDGDVTLTDASTDTLYVNAAWADKKAGDVVGEGLVFGVNAFATTKAAYMAARDLGGEITIDLSAAGTETLDSTVGFGNAGKDGVYTITGGNVNTTSYGIYINDPMDITVKFDNATFKLAKLYVESGSGELIVNNSVIGTAYYSGHNSGWVTALQGDIKITDSIFGMNFANYTEDEIKAMPRSASDVKAAVADGTYQYWAFGSNNSGPHMGTADEISVTDSTLSATWISLIDRAEMNLNNSVLYYGAAISIGAGQVDSSLGSYDSNEIGWDAQIWWGNSPAASKDGFREGEVATLNITDSIVRNIGSGNGNAGAHVQVGGTVSTTGNTPVLGQDFAGVLNLKNSEFYITPYDADGNAIAKEYDFMVVKDNGTVNMKDSKLVTAKVINEGTVNVSGESTLDIAAATGNAIQLVDGAVLTNSKLFSADYTVGSAELLVAGNASINGTYEGNLIRVSGENACLTVNGNTTLLAGGGYGQLTVGGSTDWHMDRYYTGTYTEGGELVVAEGASVSVDCLSIIANGNASIAGNVTVSSQFELSNGNIADAEAGKMTVESTGSLNLGPYSSISGELTVKGTLTDEGTHPEVAGYGALTVNEGGVLNVEGGIVDYQDVKIVNNGTITVDGGNLTADTIENTGGIVTIKGAAASTLDAEVNNGIFEVRDDAEFTNTKDINAAALYVGYNNKTDEDSYAKLTVATETTVKGANGIYTRKGTKVFVDGTLSSGSYQIKDAEMTVNESGKAVMTNLGLHLRNAGVGSTVTIKGELAFQLGANNMGTTSTIDIDNASKLIVDGGKITSYYGTGEDVNDKHAIDVNEGGTFEVKSGSVDIDNLINKKGTVNVSGESTLNIAAVAAGSNDIELSEGTILKDSTIMGDVGITGNVTFRGKNVLNNMYDFGEYGAYGNTDWAKWTVEAGSQLFLEQTVTGLGNNLYGVGYGDTVVINGELTDADAARAAGLTKDDASFYTRTGVRFSSGAGWATSSFTVNNAYVILGTEGSFSNSAKNGGSHEITFNNAVVDAAQFYFSESTATFNMSITDSNIQSVIFMTADKDSVYTLTGSKVVTTGSGNDRYNGNDGALTITDSEITVQTGSYKNSGTITFTDSTLTANGGITNTGTITLDADSNIIAQSLTGAGTITIDAAGWTGYNKVIDLSGTESLKGKVSIENLEEGVFAIYGADGDVILTDADMSKILVNEAYASLDVGTKVGDGVYAGVNAFGKLSEAINAQVKGTTESIVLESNISEDYFTSIGGANIITNVEGGVSVNNTYENWVYVSGNTHIGENVALNSTRYFLYGTGNVIDGKLDASFQNYHRYDDVITINPTGYLGNHGEAFIIRYNTENGSTGGLRVIGDSALNADAADRKLQLEASYFSFYSGTIDASNTLISGGPLYMINSTDGAGEAVIKLDNTIWNVKDNDVQSLKMDGNASIILDNYSQMTTTKKAIISSATNTIEVKNNSSFKVNGDVSNAGTITVTDSVFTAATITNSGTITLTVTADKLASVTANAYYMVNQTGNGAALDLAVNYNGASYGIGDQIVIGDTVYTVTNGDGNDIAIQAQATTVILDAAAEENLFTVFNKADTFFEMHNSYENRIHNAPEVIKVNGTNALESTASKYYVYADTDLSITGDTLDVSSANRFYFMDTVAPNGTAAKDADLNDIATVTIEEGATLKGYINLGQAIDNSDIDENGMTTRDGGAMNMIVKGTLDHKNLYVNTGSTLTVTETGKVTHYASGGDNHIRAGAKVVVNGTGKDGDVQFASNWWSIRGGEMEFNNTNAETGTLRLNADAENALVTGDTTASLTVNNSRLDAYAIEVDNADSSFTAKDSIIETTLLENAGTINIDGSNFNADGTVTNDGTFIISGESSVKINELLGTKALRTADGATLLDSSYIKGINGTPTLRALGNLEIAGDFTLGNDGNTNAFFRRDSNEVAADLTIGKTLTVNGQFNWYNGAIQGGAVEAVYVQLWNNNVTSDITASTGLYVYVGTVLDGATLTHEHSAGDQVAWLRGDLTLKNDAKFVLQQDTLRFDNEDAAVTVNASEIDGVGMSIRFASNSFVLENGATATFSGAVSNAGTINIEDSTFAAASVTNSGSFTVSGDSTLNIDTLKGATGTVTFGGATERSELSIKEKASIEANTLTINNVDVDFSGNTITATKITIDNAGVSLTGGSSFDVNEFRLRKDAAFEMSHDSVLKFVNIYFNHNYYDSSFTIDISGYTGSADKLVLDAANNDWTKDQYQDLLGTSWNEKAFTVDENGDLYIKGGYSGTVYVNSNYTDDPSDGANDGHTWGKDAFASIADAKAENPQVIVVTGGVLKGEYTNTQYLEGQAVVLAGDMTVEKTIIGGYRCASGFEFTEGSMSLTIEKGTFTKNVIGGSGVKSGEYYHTGDITLSIEGGKFGKQVAGGLYYAGESTSDIAELKGDINMTISGGTFEKYVYGGNFSKNDGIYSKQTTVDGNINLTIDASSNKIVFKEHVIAGSRSRGIVTGDINVTVTGRGDNLDFTGMLWGGSSDDYYKATANAGRQPISAGTGTAVTAGRNLTFSNYKGNFAASISMFRTISFEDGSTVNFTTKNYFQLAEVENWNFEYGSEADGLWGNDFGGDTLNFDLTGFEKDEDQTWDVISGEWHSFANWESAQVTLGGEKAVWNSETSSWCSTNYELSLKSTGEGTDKKFVITSNKLA